MTDSKRHMRDRPTDDLTQLRHIGRKSEEALNGSGIFTRRQLLSSDRARVLKILQSTQRLSDAGLDEALSDAASIEGIPYPLIPVEVTDSPANVRSVHVFHLEVIAQSGELTSTSIRHVVSGVPSVWQGFDVDGLYAFISAAVGLEPSAPSRHSRAEVGDQQAMVLKACYAARADSDVVISASEHQLGVVLAMSPETAGELGPDDRVDAAVFARSRAQSGQELSAGRVSTNVAALREGVEVTCEVNGAGTYAVEVLGEIYGPAAGGPTAPLVAMEGMTVSIRPDLPTQPPPPRLEELLRRTPAVG